MAAQAQILNQTISQTVDRVVHDRLAPLAQTVAEVMTRIIQTEHAISAIVRKMSEEPASTSSTSLFTLEEQRVFVLLQTGVITNEEARKALFTLLPFGTPDEEAAPKKRASKKKEEETTPDA